MPHGTDVRPQKWSNVIDLFDNGSYSAIWGSYENGERCLGVRWNGHADEPYGYPSQSGYPVWYVEPNFLYKSILLTILYEITRNSSHPRTEEYQRNVLLALSECE